MKKEAFRKRYVFVFCLLVFMAVFFTSLTPKATSAEKEIVWNLSAWGSKMAFTEPMHDYAAYMEGKTNGKWKIKIHYGSVLSSPKEQLDGIKAGLFELAFFVPSHAPGKIPLFTVGDLPFISPRENVHLGMMTIKLFEHPEIKKELLKWNALPFLPNYVSNARMMSRKPVRTLADLKGLRVRVGGDTGKVLAEFGAVPMMVPGVEVFEAVQKGTIDAVTFPWTFAFAANKIHEVTKFAVDIPFGALASTTFVNKDAWDALPEEFKKYHMEWYYKTPQIWAEAYKRADEKWVPIFKKYLEFIQFPTSDVDKLMEKSGPVYEEWAKRMEDRGLPGREILNYYLKERKKVAGH